MPELTIQLKSRDLNHLVQAVPKYPVSVGSLISIANRNQMPQEIINFYSHFPKNETFSDEREIITRSEQVKLLRNEETEQPQEDAVRGSED